MKWLLALACTALGCASATRGADVRTEPTQHARPEPAAAHEPARSGQRPPLALPGRGVARVEATSAAPVAPEPARDDSAKPPEPSGPSLSTPFGRITCPEEMALVQRITGWFCVDRWEGSIQLIGRDGARSFNPGNRTIDGRERLAVAVSVPGRKPQGYISGKQAAIACGRAGKRLCTIDEWVTACRGSKRTLYPYGDQRRAKQCNDRFKVLDYHPVPRLWKKVSSPDDDPKLMWHPDFMDDPRLHEMSHTVFATGAAEACTNDFGVYDMVGNLHEWVDDADGTFFGGFFMDTYQNGEGCEYRTTGHGFTYHDYSTGFRCCADPRAAPVSSDPDAAP